MESKQARSFIISTSDFISLIHKWLPLPLFSALRATSHGIFSHLSAYANLSLSLPRPMFLVITIPSHMLPPPLKPLTSATYAANLVANVNGPVTLMEISSQPMNSVITARAISCNVNATSPVPLSGKLPCGKLPCKHLTMRLPTGPLFAAIPPSRRITPAFSSVPLMFAMKYTATTLKTDSTFSSMSPTTLLLPNPLLKNSPKSLTPLSSLHASMFTTSSYNLTSPWKMLKLAFGVLLLSKTPGTNLLYRKHLPHPFLMDNPVLSMTRVTPMYLRTSLASSSCNSALLHTKN